jgi:hypothetical protein
MWEMTCKLGDFIWELIGTIPAIKDTSVVTTNVKMYDNRYHSLHIRSINFFLNWETGIIFLIIVSKAVLCS